MNISLNNRWMAGGIFEKKRFFLCKLDKDWVKGGRDRKGRTTPRLILYMIHPHYHNCDGGGLSCPGVWSYPCEINSLTANHKRDNPTIVLPLNPTQISLLLTASPFLPPNKPLLGTNCLSFNIACGMKGSALVALYTKREREGRQREHCREVPKLQR